MRARRSRQVRSPRRLAFLRHLARLHRAITAYKGFPPAARLAYKLHGRLPVACTVAEAISSNAFGAPVRRTVINDDQVSTVFLGLDHNWIPGAPPLLFETMIFLAGQDDFGQTRYTTWEQAEAGHEVACDTVRTMQADAAKIAANIIHTTKAT